MVGYTDMEVQYNEGEERGRGMSSAADLEFTDSEASLRRENGVQPGRADSLPLTHLPPHASLMHGMSGQTLLIGHPPDSTKFGQSPDLMKFIQTPDHTNSNTVDLDDTTQHFMTPRTMEKAYQCAFCKKTFQQKNTYQNHLRSHNKDGEDPYQCDICGKTFAVPARLTRHYRTHTGEKPYQCEYCMKSFSVKENLSVHRRIHTKERPYKCDICERAFEHSGKLHRHMRIHTGERPHKCNICNKTFIQSGQLVIHMRTHTGEKPYICKICQKGFTCSKQLKVHTRTHTGEKPYICYICGKSFGYNHVLKLHQVAHYGEKVYKCTLCNDTFPSKKTLEHHIKNHASSSKSANTTSKNSNSEFETMSSSSDKENKNTVDSDIEPLTPGMSESSNDDVYDSVNMRKKATPSPLRAPPPPTPSPPPLAPSSTPPSLPSSSPTKVHSFVQWSNMNKPTRFNQPYLQKLPSTQSAISHQVQPQSRPHSLPQTSQSASNVNFNNKNIISCIPIHRLSSPPNGFIAPASQRDNIHLPQSKMQVSDDLMGESSKGQNGGYRILPYNSQTLHEYFGTVTVSQAPAKKCPDVLPSTSTDSLLSAYKTHSLTDASFPPVKYTEMNAELKLEVSGHLRTSLQPPSPLILCPPRPDPSRSPENLFSSTGKINSGSSLAISITSRRKNNTGLPLSSSALNQSMTISGLTHNISILPPAKVTTSKLSDSTSPVCLTTHTPITPPPSTSPEMPPPITASSSPKTTSGTPPIVSITPPPTPTSAPRATSRYQSTFSTSSASTVTSGSSGKPSGNNAESSDDTTKETFILPLRKRSRMFLLHMDTVSGSGSVYASEPTSIMETNSSLESASTLASESTCPMETTPSMETTSNMETIPIILGATSNHVRYSSVIQYAERQQWSTVDEKGRET